MYIYKPIQIKCDVLVSGHFATVHADHCRLFEFASKFGKVTVGINGEEIHKRKYGDKAIPLSERAFVLKANRYVDEVVFFNEEDPSELIRKLHPKYFVRGPDYLGKELPEQEALNEVGAKLIIHERERLHSSTQLLRAFPRRVVQTELVCEEP